MSAAWSNKQSVKSRLWAINITLAFLVVSLVVVKAVMTNAQVAVGTQANQLSQSQQQLSNSISHLKWQIAQFKSLSYIQQYATDQLDMTPVQKNIIYLPAPQLSDEAP